MAETLEFGITENGVNQGDLVKYLNNIKDLVNELKADHASFRSLASGDAIINATTLSVGSTAENVASTAFQYKIDGVTYAKAAVTAGTAFSAADTINTGAATGFFWGVWAVQINAAGTISTKSPASDQVYATEALAIAALPAADAGNVVIGYVTVNSNEDVDWVAQTDDLTDASDCLEANFYSTATSIPAALTNSTDLTLDAG